MVDMQIFWAGVLKENLLSSVTLSAVAAPVTSTRVKEAEVDPLAVSL
jgi:hypothetical protein